MQTNINFRMFSDNNKQLNARVDIIYLFLALIKANDVLKER